MSTLIRQQMTLEAVNQANLAASTGVASGKIRFNRYNGTLMQHLLFRDGLDRKPVSIARFRIIWRLLSQRNLLMPLVRPKGIYCFYSASLITRLTRLIDGRRCLEIGAGDGTLSRFLSERGVDIVATDDYSWADSIDYPSTVIRQSASKALRTREPEVVITSWTPPANLFERQIFATPSVQTYITIGSQHESETGDWTTYRTQQSFDQAHRPDLAKLVLPPENDNAVLIFQRRHKK
ncbi:class I SAM-dependent methyltransferase [Kineosporia rhizophila]|uniref:class I SAM-dependent methyltransferase n=1 Tax=Kineosporia rhizophila TaxID=84633 RepID=UPI001E300103|nr:class I SAM-dependent methyltransferase [Kineosporia rhizophila]MCE0536130.1 class I SAM-dependent methyltransferase [Kineosporia rhizophila]